MKKALLALFTAMALAGCGSGTSTPIAPDVKEPDNRNVSGAEILKRKLGSDSQKTP
jgi:hypothetical protein